MEVVVNHVGSHVGDFDGGGGAGSVVEIGGVVVVGLFWLFRWYRAIALMVADGICLLRMRCGTEMRMLENGERNIHLKGRRTMAIYTLDGQ